MRPFIAASMQTLVALYSAPKRFYHNLDHINFGLGRFEWAKQQAEFMSLSVEDWNRIETAWWWHDAIYNAHAQQENSGYSERESVYLMRELASTYRYHNLQAHQLVEFDTEIDVAEMLIRGTAKHVFTQKGISQSHKLMRDIDLASLGLPWDHYLYNTESVCQEYEMSDSDAERLRIAAGNVGFIKRLLGRQRIYYTDAFHDKYEKQARSNLTRRIEQVTQMVNHDQP